MTKRIDPSIDSRILSKSIVESIYGLWNKSISDNKIAKILNIHSKTVAKYRNKKGLKPSGWERQFVDFITQSTAKCSRCKEIKSLEGWPKQRGKYCSYCAVCRQNRLKNSTNRDEESNLRVRWCRLKARCSKNKILFDIEWEDFINQWNLQGGKCFYSDVALEWKYGYGSLPNSCSVDKVEPHLGYIKGNVVFCAQRINTIKFNISLEEMKIWLPSWFKRVETWRSSIKAEGDF